mgnify:FL=1
MRVLIIAWIAVLVTQGGWTFIEGVFSDPADLPRIAQFDPATAESSEVLVLHVTPQGDRVWRPSHDYSLNSSVVTRWLGSLLQQHKLGPLVEGWHWLSTPWVRIFRMETNLIEACQLFLCGTWGVVVWALAGGAICRIAARYMTRADIIDPFASLRSAASKWSATAGAPLVGLLFAGLVLFPLALMGVLLRIDLFALVAGLIWGLYLIWGIFLAVVLVALWFGWPLAWAAIGVERCDALDAASRATSYVYQAPLRLVFYVVFATLLGIFGQLVLSGFATAGNELTDWAVSWGAGSERTAALASQPLSENSTITSGTGVIGARSIHFWKNMLSSFAASYPMAFLWCASTGIYLLQRHQVDSTEMDEIVGEPGENIRSPHAPLASGTQQDATDPQELSTRRA